LRLKWEIARLKTTARAKSEVQSRLARTPRFEHAATADDQRRRRARTTARTGSEGCSRRRIIEGLRSLGFRVERAKRGTPATGTDMLIDGQFLTVDEGNPLHSLVIGFGNGASSVQTQVQVYQGPDARKIMEFTTQSDSSKMPGAAATMAAGAAVSGGVTAGMVAANAAASGVKTYKSDVARMAADSGDQVARYLSDVFEKQGWIRPDQVRKARIIY